MRQATGSLRGLGRFAFRGVEAPVQELESVAFEVAWWNHPFILLSVLTWAVARGSGAVAAEVERGTLDLILSRPVSRSAYLASHVLVAGLGLAVLAAALVAGNLAGTRYNRVETPATFLVLARPALNLAALGLAVHGYTLLFSALESVRWRPNLIGSVLDAGRLHPPGHRQRPSARRLEVAGQPLDLQGLRPRRGGGPRQ